MSKNNIDDELSEFLRCHNFTPAEFANTGLDWSLLKDIRAIHTSHTPGLLSTAQYLSGRLQEIKDVHSIKVRIKNPDNLIAKIIRKKLRSSDFEVNCENYADGVTDLIGIRALHLFKDQWFPIHEFVSNTWDLHEEPIAYIRAGDPEAILGSFRDAKCRVEEHPFGYRSIHYIIKSQPEKQRHLAELQVRTIFEEGWSEIDHRIRYPRFTSDPYLAEFLTIFNRLAGSADEMGTFIKRLAQRFAQQQQQIDLMKKKIAEQEAEVKGTLSKLSIDSKEKKKLQEQIAELRKSSQGLAGLGGVASRYAVERVNQLPPITPTEMVYYVGSESSERTCTKCGQRYYPYLGEPFYQNKCPSCHDGIYINPIK